MPPTEWLARPARCRNVAIERVRAELAHELDVADVDAELERCRRDERLELAVLQPLLGRQPPLLRHAAVVRHHVLGAQQLGQVPRHALGHPPRVDEHERGAMLRDRSASRA